MAQYKVLERKSQDRASASYDGKSFLIESNIKVKIEYDVARYIDRAVELINRTNQLNFTKLRLSEDPTAARTDLLRQIEAFDVQAALIIVNDRYGDYGFVGFYLLQADGYGKRLKHFCFSCRTLNMGVERYVYQMIGCPSLAVVGEVLTDLKNQEEVDWINLGDDDISTVQNALPPIFARGGCDFSAITHYLASSTPEILSELVSVREGINIRLDHSLFLRYATVTPTQAEMTELVRLGYSELDFRSQILAPRYPRAIRLVGLWGDANSMVYRHTELGFVTPFELPGLTWGVNLIKAEPAYIEQKLVRTETARSAMAHLRENFVCTGYLPLTETQRNLHGFLEANSPEDILMLILANEDPHKAPHSPDGIRRNRLLDGAIQDVAGKFSNVHLLRPEDFVHSDSEVIDLNHFGRMVYFRISNGIRSIVEKTPAI